jgi:nucleotide-binding universal stress UspA family protein
MSASPHDGTLRKILLATDLSARCDRALDRAVLIARDSPIQLVILHAYEEFDEASLTYRRFAEPSWRAPLDATAIAKARIRQDLQADVADVSERAAVLIVEGEPAEAIQQVAEAERIDLIVTGIAGERPFARRPVILGRTIEKVLRQIAVPILIVRNRPRARYQHIVVTTDLSAASAHALQMALRFFPHQSLHLLHAFQVPYASEAGGLPNLVEGFRQTHEVELTQFLASMVLPDDARRRLITHVEMGVAAQLVREYVRDRGADLVVLGTRGRASILEALLGSTAKAILGSVPCDALVVSEPLRRAPRTG